MNLDKEVKMAELHNIHAETAKLQAETARLNAETLKLQKETKYYPYVVAGGLGGLVGAIISFIIKAL